MAILARIFPLMISDSDSSPTDMTVHLLYNFKYWQSLALLVLFETFYESCSFIKKVSNMYRAEILRTKEFQVSLVFCPGCYIKSDTKKNGSKRIY